MDEQRADFERMMRERFLAGEDGAHVDYAAIDEDEGLDDLNLAGEELPCLDSIVLFVRLHLCASESSLSSLVKNSLPSSITLNHVNASWPPQVPPHPPHSDKERDRER